MNCKSCGAEIADGAEVCAVCGMTQQSAAGMRHKTLLVCVTAFAALCVVGAAYAFNAFRTQDAAQTKESVAVEQDVSPSVGVVSVVPAASAQTHEVVVPIVAEGLTDAGGRIPIHVQGTTDRGESLAQESYLSYDGTGLSLPAGTYAIRILESPISYDGALYRVSGDTRSVKVEASGAFAVTPEGPLTCVPMSALDVTNEQIEAAVTWILRDSERVSAASMLRDAAYGRREHSLGASAGPSAEEYGDDGYSEFALEEGYDAVGMMPDASYDDASYYADEYNDGTVSYEYDQAYGYSVDEGSGGDSSDVDDSYDSDADSDVADAGDGFDVDGSQTTVDDWGDGTTDVGDAGDSADVIADADSAVE